MTKRELLEKIRASKARSAWARGVKVYACELVEALEDLEEGSTMPTDFYELFNLVLNGAGTFKEYSWGGSSLIYDEDIAERLCTPSELKITRNGQRKPNKREEWLDVQARAIYQGYLLIRNTVGQ